MKLLLNKQSQRPNTGAESELKELRELVSVLTSEGFLEIKQIRRITD